MSAHIWTQPKAALEEMLELIRPALGPDLIDARIEHDELGLSVRPQTIVETLTFLRDEPRLTFRQMVDLCGVDFPDREQRFDVVYHLLSMHANRRVRVRIETDETTPVPTVTGVFPTAGWFEREAWDLFGIFFSGNPDLRRLLTDYGFEGHPLRKDFPLTGYVEVRYDDEQKRVVYEPVALRQDFRTFDFLSPWEGHGGLLPGDEKTNA